MKRVKVLTLLLKVLTLLLLLCAVSVIGIACSGDGKLHIDAPTEIQAELGVYAVPKYDVVDEEGVVMAGYTVTLKSVKDESGNAVDISGGLTVKEPSIYYLEYTANSKKVPNVKVKVDFADRTPPEVNVDVADFPALFVKGREYSIPKFSFGAAPDLSKCWMKIYYKSAEGTKTEKELDGTYFKVTEDRGEYEFVFHGEDAAGNVNEVKHVVPVDGPNAFVENVAVYAEEFGTRQVDTSAKTKIEVANDASKGSTLKITLTGEQSGQNGANVVFQNVSPVRDYDYISFDIKSSVDGVYAGIMQYDGNGALNPFGAHYAAIGTSWKKVSFNVLQQGQFWWYDRDNRIGLYFMAGFASDATLAADTTFEITNIRLEKGNAQIANAEYNMLTYGAQYTFPKATDNHGVDHDGAHSDSTARDIEVAEVTKDGEEVALSGDKKSITFNATGEYTVYYKVDNTEYTYVVTVINVPIEDVTLYYGASEEYALPTQTVGGKTISVSGVTSAGGMVSCESGKFSLTAGTVTTANDTNTYVYTVNYKVTGDETQYSYTVTYHKPSNVAENRMVYFDSNYGITHQLTVGNGTAVSDSKYKTDNSDRGTKSTKITVSESGAVWLRFTNVPWNTAYNNLDIAFSTSSVLRYAIYDANGNNVKEEVAFAESGNADRWSGIQFAADLDDKDMSSFSIKLFNAYNENEPLAAGTEIWIVGGLGYTF